MIGCPIDLKCAVACLPSELSQQPTWPQVWHIRRCTQRIPNCRHSSQPSTSSGSSRYWTDSRCEHSGGTGADDSAISRLDVCMSLRTDLHLDRLATGEPVGLDRR